MVSLLIFIAILGLLIIAHEYGHFIIARANGVRVDAFAVGFGPVLFRKRIKQTDLQICAFPLGGYVKLAGESLTDCKGKDDEFFSKPAGIKSRIVAAGPLFNFLFAFLLFWLMTIIGMPVFDTIVGGVLENYPAAAAGIKPGDKIEKINNHAVSDWTEVTELIQNSPRTAALSIIRAGKSMELTITLKPKEINDDYGRKKSVSIAGISPSNSIKIVKYGFFPGFIQAAKTLFFMSRFMLKGFLMMITGSLPFKEAVTGPLGIYYITSEAVKLGISAIFHLMAILNVSLAIINLFPLPLMDGGHLVLFGLERIRGRRIGDKIEDYLSKAGLVMLGLLIMFVFYNDIHRFGGKIWGKPSVISSQPPASLVLKK